MTGDAYNNPWWALVYDQWNEQGGRSRQHERELTYYRAQLEGVTGRVLEAACGTGSILLPLLSDGVDVHGFDASKPMLDQLRDRALKQDANVEHRITQQDLTSFAYDEPFDAIIIPASSILMLSTQKDQIECLRTVRAHLSPGGRLLLDFFIPTAKDLATGESWSETIPLESFDHPTSDAPIEVSFKRRRKLVDQTEEYEWFFVHDGRRYTSRMSARWLNKEEFQLLLQLAGFERWSVFGSCEGAAFPSRDESNEKRYNSYWAVEASAPSD